MTTTSQKLGSFNDYRAEHPSADIADYTNELIENRARIAGIVGMSVEALHVEPVAEENTSLERGLPND